MPFEIINIGDADEFKIKIIVWCHSCDLNKLKLFDMCLVAKGNSASKSNKMNHISALSFCFQSFCINVCCTALLLLPANSQYFRCPFHLHGLTLIPAYISKYTHDYVWDEIAFPFSNISGADHILLVYDHSSMPGYKLIQRLIKWAL